MTIYITPGNKSTIVKNGKIDIGTASINGFSSGEQYSIKLISVQLVGSDYQNIVEDIKISEKEFEYNTSGSGNQGGTTTDITSSKYTINNGYISKISPNVTIEELKNGLTTSGRIEIKNKKGEIVSNTDNCATGMSLSVGNKKYELVVTGDIDGNGKISINDLAKLKLNYIGAEPLSGAYKEAADVDRNGKITLNDIARLKLVIIGKETIK